MRSNLGIIDANVRMFLALPMAVLAVTGSIAYHAYPWAAGWALGAAAIFASGWTRLCPVYALLGLCSEGGFHRVRGGRSAAPRA